MLVEWYLRNDKKIYTQYERHFGILLFFLTCQGQVFPAHDWCDAFYGWMNIQYINPISMTQFPIC